MIPFLKLLQEVVEPETEEKPQEKLVEGTKAFGKGIKEAVDKFNPFKDLSKFNPFRKK